jgi:NADPH:quinone reductase-like Zn-dependent oxidoreductase
MTAAVHDRFGGPDVVRVGVVPRPAVGSGDVLVRVQASTVSAADRRARSRDVPRGLAVLAAAGLGLMRPRHPVLGMDVAGVVESVGSHVDRFATGDAVVAMLGPGSAATPSTPASAGRGDRAPAQHLVG